MRVSREALIYIREQIELHTKLDPNITDVIINYRVKETEGVKNFLKIDI
jgi:hypothetical protein|tara:strand:- start:1351 stop:1497 length:147 start_codon:yes stop_codon:yes gene_type:complete